VSDQQPPYGEPPPPYQPYGQGQPYTPPANPAYGYGYGGSHGGATTSLVLGIISIAVAVLGTCLCFFVGALSVFIGPVGIVLALKARREIDAAPQLYNNRGNAVGGLVTSIIGTVLGALVLIGMLVLFAIWGFAFSAVYS
jgi:hypothetical protein